MSRLLRTVLVALLAVSAGGLLVAHSNQAPLGWFWWRDSGFIKQLGLRSEQTTKIEAIWQETRDELRTEIDELDRRESKLTSMIDQGEVEAMVIRQINRVESARANLTTTRAVMAYRMRAVLTTAQRKQMEAIAPAPAPNRAAPGASGTRPPAASGNPGGRSSSNGTSTGSPSGPSSSGSVPTGSSPGRATTPR